MGISKIVGMAVKNGAKFVLNRGLGIMTERQVQASVLNLGRKAKAAGVLDAQKVASIMDDVLPKGVRRPRILSSIDEVDSFIKKETFMPDKMVAMVKNNPNVAGLCVPSQKGGASAIYTGNGVIEAPVLAHEFRHALDNDTKFLSKLRKLFTKFKPEKKTKKFSEKYGERIQKHYLSTQFEVLAADSGSLKGANIIEKLGTNEADLQKFLRSMIRQDLTTKNFKENIVLLKSTAATIRKEIPAYAVTSRISGVANSKNVSLYQEEILKSVNEELKEQKSKRLKSLFGLKTTPTDKTVIPRPEGMEEPFTLKSLYAKCLEKCNIPKTPTQFFAPQDVGDLIEVEDDIKLLRAAK